MTDSKPPRINGRLRRRFGLGLVLVGLLITILGADPGVFGLDRSPVIGFVQIAVFLFGLFLICLGGYFAIDALWHNRPKSIAYDIGLRLMATGYVLALIAGMADVLGLGTRPLPYVPFFGYWQARGVLAGQAVIIIGFMLMIPFRRPMKDL